MTDPAVLVDLAARRIAAGRIVLQDILPLVDGRVPGHGPARHEAGELVFPLRGELAGAVVRVAVLEAADAVRLAVVLEGLDPDRPVAALGLRVGAAIGVRQYLRSGYTSWDGCYFVEPEAALEVAAADPKITFGHAVTALTAADGPDVAVIGFIRHDRFQSRFRFDFAAGGLAIDVETLVDGVPHEGCVEAEPLILLQGTAVEPTLRAFAAIVAATMGARVPAERITGWCSWYNLYAAIDEPAIRHHLAAARDFRDARGVPMTVFQIDDGFTPEMGDWLDVKPQFPRGMAPLLAEIREAGFVPGLWIAPFLVGNRSRLFAEHPDWVVGDRSTGRPLVAMRFPGEFRWHKRSEAYHVLDVTHPEAEAHIRKVFRTWATDWGCGYFKTDFMHVGSEHGPERAVWHEPGLSRIAVWMRMARLIREEIGDALWLGCGTPIFAPVGLVDAVRIGRDVGVSWTGHYSAESLLRDQTARNFMAGVLWQADPDCVLLRAEHHDLSDDEVRSLIEFMGLAGGVLVTSDDLSTIPPDRADLFAVRLGEAAHGCDYPELGRTALRYRLGRLPSGEPNAVAIGDPVILQRARLADGTLVVNLFNTGDRPVRRLVSWDVLGADGPVTIHSAAPIVPLAGRGLLVEARPHQAVLLVRDPNA